ncbi:MAG: glycosyltransferase [Solirubrobacteraceae bacterium]
MPLRRWEQLDPDPLPDYLEWLTTRVEVIVVDGSAPELFARHREAWGRLVTHVPVAPTLLTANGKVGGVITGVHMAPGEKIVIADEDVRYDDVALARIASALDEYDLVRPQNYFSPLSWPARWDTARTLLNRAFGTDFPGTLAVRRSTFTSVGGYAGDVVFENLELLRTAEAAGAHVASCPSLYVRRLPPAACHFGRQRVRYAYESLAQPWRMALELSIAPGIAVLGSRHRSGLVAAAIATALVAETGRRRAGGRPRFPATSSMLAPCWLVERGTCSWVALWLRVARGGLRYGDTTIRTAANSTRALSSRSPRRSDAA